MKVEDESGKADLKLCIQKTKIMTSGPITSWQIDGETVEAVRGFIFLGSKITEDSSAAMKFKDAPWKKGYDTPRRCFKKQRHLLTKVHIVVKSCGFSINHVRM